MKGQRSSLIRGTLALILCAILLSTIFTTIVFADRHTAAAGREDPTANQAGATISAPDPDGGMPTDGGSGNGDPPNEGDPDDYDKIVIQFVVSLVQSPLYLIH